MFLVFANKSCAQTCVQCEMREWAPRATSLLIGRLRPAAAGIHSISGTMEQKLWQNREDDDMYMHDARQEIDKKLRRERDEIDKKVKTQRESVDRMIKEEREKMFLQMKQMHEEMDENIKKERAALDQKIKEEREKYVGRLKHIHQEMDKKLERDREDMDRIITVERAKMDFASMQERANMDRQLQDERDDMDRRIHLEQIHMEGQIMQERAMINTKAKPEQCNISLTEKTVPDSTPVVLLECLVFKDEDHSHIPRGYNEERPGEMNFTKEPVLWTHMLQGLQAQGYKHTSDVYYIRSGYVPPDGMVLLSCQEDVDAMIKDLQGKKICDLYLVRNYPPSDYGYGDDDMDIENNYGYEEVVPIVLEVNGRRNRDSDED